VAHRLPNATHDPFDLRPVPYLGSEAGTPAAIDDSGPKDAHLRQARERLHDFVGERAANSRSSTQA